MKNEILIFLAFSIGIKCSSQPVITAFFPSSGPVGSTVIITGINFDPIAINNIVFFGATRATVFAATTTSLTVTVPIGATYQFISVSSVDNLTAYSSQPFITTFLNGGIINGCSFAPSIDIGTGVNPYNASIGDLDGDGKADLVVSNVNSNSISILLNASMIGKILFKPKMDFPTERNPYRVLIKDLDGDGKPDIIVTNVNSNSISFFRNISIPGIISLAPRVDFPAGNYISDFEIAMGDLDGDGKPDLIVANYNAYLLHIFKNTSTIGAISFGSQLDYSTSIGPYSIDVGDLDGDKKADIAVSNLYTSTVSVFRNTSTNGNINLAPKIDFPTSIGNEPYSVSIGDLNGDGKLDIVTANYRTSTVSILKNTCTNGIVSFASKIDFQSGPAAQAGQSSFSCSISDIDGDGKLDIVTANYSSSTVSVLKNISTIENISFAKNVDISSGSNPFNVSIGDLDGDGKPDLITGNNGPINSETISVLRNTVTSMISSVTPHVSIVASPTNFCSDTSVTFAATADNIGGGTVSYNFKVNGNSVQDGISNTYIASNFTSGFTISCEINVSGGTCLTTNTATSKYAFG